MTHADAGRWSAHATLTKFTAAAERDTMHDLAPCRAAVVESARKSGIHLPNRMIPRVSADAMMARGFAPTVVEDYPGNLLVNAGINRMEALLLNAGATQAYDATHTAIGVGDTATAAAATDVDLNAAVAAANRYIQVADATYPSAAAQVVTIQSTFATGNANFVWNEWGVGQNTTSGAVAITAPMLNHKVTNLGTKTSAAAWALKITIQIS